MIAWAAIRALAGGRELGGDGLHQRFDAEDVDHPLHVVGEHLQAHFRTTFSSVLVRKWVLPIHALRVPKGCSTVWRRMVMASGKRSSLACILSRTPSCSQRFRRLCLSGVQVDLSAQVEQAVRLR